MNGHLFGASDPDSAKDRKELQDTFRAKHRDAINGTSTDEN